MMPTPFLSGQRPTAAAADQAVEKQVARGGRITSSTTTTTIQGVLELHAALKASYNYLFFTSNLRLTGGANDGQEVTLRPTHDGSTPTTATAAAGSGGARTTSASIFEDAMVSFDYTPPADETIKVLLCISRVVGSAGSSSIGGATAYPIKIYIENKGLDVGDTGISI